MPVPQDLTQEEVYALYGTYGGYLDEKARSQLEHLLEEMAYPEQIVGDVRVAVGDRLYFPALRTLELLQRQAAAQAPAKTPEIRTYRTRAEVVREAVAARAQAGHQWRELVARATAKKNNDES